jgi:hypothetical protein
MNRWGIVVAVAAMGATVFWLIPKEQHKEPPAVAAPVPHAPPVDAAQITSGRLPMERMPQEVGKALETYSEELVRNSEEIATKQARIHGTCAPGSAIRVIAEDGSVRCQMIGHGVISVSALTAVARLSSTITEVGSVQGGVGRYQADGEDDYLIAAVPLPDGSTITAFTYTFFDSSQTADSEAFLYRSDDEPMASVKSAGAENAVRSLGTEQVRLRKVDGGRYAYFVYFQVSSTARANLMPISASISYTTK